MRRLATSPTSRYGHIGAQNDERTSCSNPRARKHECSPKLRDGPDAIDERPTATREAQQTTVTAPEPDPLSRRPDEPTLAPLKRRSPNRARPNPTFRPAFVGLGLDDPRDFGHGKKRPLSWSIEGHSRGLGFGFSRGQRRPAISSIERATRWLMVTTGPRVGLRGRRKTGTGWCRCLWGTNAGVGPWSVRGCSIRKPSAMTGAGRDIPTS
jgi:hypothetical protein